MDTTTWNTEHHESLRMKPISTKHVSNKMGACDVYNHKKCIGYFTIEGGFDLNMNYSYQISDLRVFNIISLKCYDMNPQHEYSNFPVHL